MDYPFPGLPPEITQEISLRDPQAFGRLSSTSRRLRQSLLPKLEEICNRRITAEEIAHYYHTVIKPDHRRSLTFRNPLENRDILFSEIIIRTDHRGNTSYFPFSYNRQLLATGTFQRTWIPEMVPFIRDLLRQGYRPDLENTYNILVKRQSCQRVPRFALRALWKEFLDRLNLDLPIIRQMATSPVISDLIQTRLSMPIQIMVKLMGADAPRGVWSLIYNIRQQDPATQLQSLLDYLPIMEKEINSLSP